MNVKVTPYKDTPDTKKQQVATMFDRIAGRYDFFNHFFSLGIDRYWRRKSISILKTYHPQTILDVATGTGDFALSAVKTGAGRIVGIDISAQMLAVGMLKIQKRKLEGIIELKEGDSEKIQFPDNSFDAVTVAFGVRNFENLDAGLKEMHRVLNPGGHVIILEFSKPRIFPVKHVYYFYSHLLIPILGKLFSNDKSAYSYLPESVDAFPCGVNFVGIMTRNGFHNAKQLPLTFGIATLYTGQK